MAKFDLTTFKTRIAQISVRARVILLAVILAIPLIGERVRGLESGRDDRIWLASNQMADLARQGAAAQNVFLKGARSILEAVALTPYADDPSLAGCHAYLKELEKRVDALNTLSILSPDGKIVCTSREKGLGLNIGDRRQVRAAIANHGFASGDVVMGHSRLQPVYGVALAKYDGDRLRTVVVGTIDLKYLAETLSQLGARAGYEAFIIDGNNTILTRYPYAQKWTGRKIGPVLAGIVPRQQSGVITAVDLEQQRRVYGFHNLPGTNIYFIVGISEKVLLANIDRQIVISYLILGAITIIGLLLIWLGGEQFIVKPIRRLCLRAARIGRGDYSNTNAMQDMPAEFTPLGRAFVEIQHQLARRELRLREENSELDMLAQSDPMTGLANRRRLDARLSSFLEQCASAKTALTVFMIDVDHFKAFNDHYGHIAGDQCLKTIATTIKSWFRDSDLVVRYGGEEFVVLVPGLSSTAMRVLAVKICEAVKALQIPHCVSAFGTVTVSIGLVHAVPEIGRGAIDFLQQADTALYRAKDLGRNTVAIYGEAKDLAIAS